jgi:phage tail sheath protein FI
LQPPAFGDDEIHALQVAMLTHCLRLRDRFAILDVRRQDLQPTQAEEWRNEFTYEESFAALYYPWIRVNDPLELEGLVRTIPPSGHIAGVFARTDLTQGVHQAPGNEVVEGVRDVVFAVNSREHGDLNSVGVNVILPWPGGGIRVFGARTLYQAPLLRYINVRRLLLWIEEAIDESTQWIVFEPNNDALRRDTDRAVRGLLESLFRRGMLDGAKIDDAFSVQCDERNNPPEEVDAGRLICEVGVQPPRPAEFVVVRIGRTQSGIEVLEERSVARG